MLLLSRFLVPVIAVATVAAAPAMAAGLTQLRELDKNKGYRII